MQHIITGIVLGTTLLFSTPQNKLDKFDNVTVLKEKGFKPLFDGKTTKGWHSWGKQEVGSAWKIEEGGVLHLDNSQRVKGTPQQATGGDLVTDAEFENFHLKLDWKISEKGNSGIIFWVQDEPTKYKEVWHTGPEMQVLDNDGHSDGKINKHRAGNLYDLIAGTEGVVKAVGEWNTAEIISNKGKLELRLNGVTVVSTNYGDDNWKELVAKSKFKNLPDFAKVAKGHFALQDHGNDVWFRNIVIKKL